MIYIIYQSTKWDFLYKIEKYEKLFESSIVEIKLRESVDSAEWAVFSDDDLVKKWESFLKAVKVKRKEAILEDEKGTNGGGGFFIDIITETSEFDFCLIDAPNHSQFKINGCFYDIKSDIEIPFTETFNAAIERHGITTPWD